jgi:spermidine/putrescine transport system permease protein
MLKSFRNSSTPLLMFLAFCVLGFLYLPLIVVAVYSFNPDLVNSFPMSGFSLRWYEAVFQNDALIRALKNSVMLSITATIIALCLSIPGAFALYRYKFFGSSLIERGVLLPMMLPGILTGVAMLSFFQEIGIMQGFWAVLIGHSTFLTGVILPQVYARLRRLDPAIEEASADLGATRAQTFIHILLPNIKTALIGASLLSFTLSLDEIPVTFFLNGLFSTLPLEIWGMTRNGITPEVNAISTLIFVFSLVLIIASTVLTNKED